MHRAGWGLLAVLYGALAPAASALEFAAPDFLGEPAVSHTAYSVTLSYRGRSPQSLAALQITLVRVPADALTDGRADARQCLALSLDEMRKVAPNLFLQPVATDLEVGPFVLRQMRWLRRRDGREVTGVTACGVDGDRYLSVSFEDSLHGAVGSFPALRTHLRALRLSP